jgi:chromosome segregation protein
VDVYLKSLEMLGFKSFAEAKIQFPEGITAIVGPNGSGKSNVVDSILWVLGEQSTKTLRSERMEDVIFNGTEVRKPLGMVEVSLVIGGLGDLRLDSIAGLPSQLGEYQELQITRRLYRNGDSEYLINKTSCRLKDIRSVLIETRAGSKGHTVIEQGRIEQILQASPQDRRELIEETAGIVRYKKQKAEALRKLESTQQNLLRVRDIIAEVKKQLNSLERQARQARSYQTLQQESRALEIELLSRDYRAMHGDLDAIEQQSRDIESRESGQAAEQARLETEHEAIRFRLHETAETIAQVRDRLAGTEQRQSQALSAAELARNRVQMLEQQRLQATQEIDRLHAEREQATAEIEGLRANLLQLEAEMAEQEQLFAQLDMQARTLAGQRSGTLAEEERGRKDVLNLAVLVANTEQNIDQLTKRQGETTARCERLVEEQNELTGKVGMLDELRLALTTQRGEVGDRLRALSAERDESGLRIEQLGHEASRLDGDIMRLSEELAGVESRLGTLQAVVREDMGYGREGDEEETALKSCQGVRDALAEWLIVPEGLDRSIETILGERIRAWLVDEPRAACRAVEFLKERQLGRGAFIPQGLRWDSVEQDGAALHAWWEQVQGQPGVIGRAVELVRAREEAPTTLTYLFDGVVVVESLEVALRLWEQHRWTAPSGPTFVSLSGDVLDAAGVITGGATTASGGLLQRRREVLEMEARRTEAIEQLSQARRAKDEASRMLSQTREQEQRLAGAIREGEFLQLSLQKDDAGVAQRRSDLDRRLEALGKELQQAFNEQARIGQELSSGEIQLGQWTAEKSGQETRLAQVRERVAILDQQGMELQQRLTEARLAVETLRSRREHGTNDVSRLDQRLEAARHRAAELELQLSGVTNSIEQSRDEGTRQESLCQELGFEVDRIKSELVREQERQAEEMASLQTVEEGLAETRRALSASRDERMTVEVRKAEVKTQLATLESTLAGTYQIDPTTLLGLAEEAPRAEPTDESEVSAAPLAVVETSQLRERLQKLRERLDRMGPINLAAIEEHRELDERHKFLTAQEQDLSSSIASLKEIIQRINRTTKDMFVNTFNELQQKFIEVFSQFFRGGRAELQLVEEPVEEGADQNGAREPGVEIVAQPPGKRLKSITMLSGGEKTLTAMALLIASFLIRPTPFCILDEIDAPLDEENIGRFTSVLRTLSSTAQFLVITHNKRTMAMADSLFGVTMEEPGVSKIISVKLADLQPA